jgi:hypothetical protein
MRSVLQLAAAGAAMLGLAASVVGSIPAFAQGEGYKRRVPISGVGSGVGPATAERQRVYGNYSSCVVRGEPNVAGDSTLVNTCDVALYVSYCSLGDASARSDCSRSASSKVIDGQRTYGSTEVLGPRARTPVAVKPQLEIIWLACDQKQGLAYLAGDPASPKGYCGDGIPVPNQTPVDATVKQGAPAEPSGSSRLEALMDTQQREEAAGAAQANRAATERFTQAESEAARKQREERELADRKRRDAEAAQAVMQVPQTMSGAAASGATGPATSTPAAGNCEQIQAAAAQRARAQTFSKSCSQNRQTVAALRTLTNQVVSACGSNSRYGQMWLSEYRQAEANMESAVRYRLCQ